MNLIYPYFLFQLLYILFDAWVQKKELASVHFQFTTPYWLLWYLLAIIFYYLLLPFIKGVSHPGLLFVSVCILSVAAGFDQTIGYYLSLSRFIVFLPYFVLGVILSKANIQGILEKPVTRIINAAVAAGSCFLLYKPGLVRVQALYGSYPYAAGKYSFLMRIILLVIGVNWILLFLSCFPRRRIPLLSAIGRNTMQLFLLHGLIRKYLEYRGGVFNYSVYGNYGLAILISILIILLFGNKYAGKFFQLICTGKGVELLCRKLRLIFRFDKI